MGNQEYKIWLIEDDARVIKTFSDALNTLGGEITITTNFRDAYQTAEAELDCGMIFVDNTLGDDEDVGPAIVGHIKALGYCGHIVSNSFGRLQNPITGTDLAFPKDRCKADTVISFIVRNY